MQAFNQTVYIPSRSVEELTFFELIQYQKIDEPYGTLEDWQDLLDDLHARKMKLM